MIDIDTLRGNSYKKEIGIFGATFMGLSAIVGSAVLFTPITVLAAAGPAGILAWAIGAIMMMIIGLIYVELATVLPRSGGAGVYPHISNGSIAGLFNNWGVFLGYVLAPVSEVVAMVEYLSFFFPFLFNLTIGTLTIYGELITIAVVFLFFLGNYFGVKYLNKANSYLTWLKLLSLAFIGIFFLAFYFHPANFVKFHGGFIPYGSSGLLFATAVTVYAYGGFRQPIEYAEEIKNPKKHIPIAVVLSIILSFILYEILSMIFIGDINWSYLAITQGNWAKLSTLTFPLPAVAFGVGLAIMGYFIFVTSIHSSASSSLVYSGGAARVLSVMGENGYIPRVFSKLSKNGVPYISVIVVLIISAFYTFLIPVFISIALVFVDASLVSYAPAAISLLVFRKYLNVNKEGTFRLPFANILAPAGFIVGSLLLYWTGFTYLRIALPSVLVVVILFLFSRRNNKIDRREIKAGIWYPIYLIAVLIMSYIGSTDFGGINIIKYPFDIVTFVIISIIFYFIGLRSGYYYMSTSKIESSV